MSKKKILLFKALLVLMFLGFIACTPPKTDDGNSKNSGDNGERNNPNPNSNNTVLQLTIDSDAGSNIAANKYANKGYTTITFVRDGGKKSTIAEIRKGAFMNNKFKKFVLPDTVRTVQENALKGNPITDFTIGKNADTIAYHAFNFDTTETVTVKLRIVPNYLDTAKEIATIFGRKKLVFMVDPSLTEEANAETDGVRKKSITDLIAAISAKISDYNTKARTSTTLKKVTFESGEGSDVPALYVTTGTAATKPTSPTRVNYYAEGWYLEEALTNKFDFATNIDKDTTLYAKWLARETGETLRFYDPDDTSTVSGVFSVGNSGAAWKNKHPVEGGNNGVGIVVSATKDRYFTFSAQKTNTTSGADDGAVRYTAEKIAGDEVNDTFTLNGTTGKVTLKANNKGGKYLITATKAATERYKESTASYTVWITIPSPLQRPANTEYFTFQSGSPDKFRVRRVSGGKTTIPFTTQNSADKGTITYTIASRHGTNDEFSIDRNSGEITILKTFFIKNDPVRVDKAAWEYFRPASYSYRVEFKEYGGIQFHRTQTVTPYIHPLGILRDGEGDASSGMRWTRTHPVESNSDREQYLRNYLANSRRDFGAVVNSAPNKEFTYTPQQIRGDNRRKTYRAEKLAGDEVNDTFTLDSGTAKITLKGNNRGGKYKIIAEAPETPLRSAGTGFYLLWVLKNNAFTFPALGAITTKTGSGTYTLADESGAKVVTAVSAANNDTFTLALTLGDAADKGAITYASDKPTIATVTSVGVVTIVDATKLNEVVTITVRKAMWEYFDASTITYTLKE